MKILKNASINVKRIYQTIISLWAFRHETSTRVQKSILTKKKLQYSTQGRSKSDL